MTNVIGWPKAQIPANAQQAANKPSRPLGRTVDQMSIGNPELKKVLKETDLPLDTIEGWFDTRIDPFMNFSIEGETAYISASNNFRRDRISQRFKYPLEVAVKKLYPQIKSLKIILQ